MAERFRDLTESVRQKNQHITQLLNDIEVYLVILFRKRGTFGDIDLRLSRFYSTIVYSGVYGVQPLSEIKSYKRHCIIP